MARACHSHDSTVSELLERTMDSQAVLQHNPARRTTRLLVQILAFFLSSAACAEPTPLRFDHISLRQGLSNFNVMAIVQDRQGFLWMGTEDGLDKYDGVQFTVYKHDPADSLSLPSSGVSSLFVGHDGNVWIGTPRGLAVSTPWDPRPRRVRIDTGGAGRPLPLEVTRILEDRRGGLWVGTALGILYRQPGSEAFRRVFLPLNQVLFVTAIVETSNNEIWVGTGGGGIFRLHSDSNTVVLLPQLPAFGESSDFRFITTMLEDRRGFVWIGSINGLARYDPRAFTLDRFASMKESPVDLPRDLIHSIFEDRHGVIWIGST